LPFTPASKKKRGQAAIHYAADLWLSEAAARKRYRGKINNLAHRLVKRATPQQASMHLHQPHAHTCQAASPFELWC
jgi:hypothetical protein